MVFCSRCSNLPSLWETKRRSNSIKMDYLEITGYKSIKYQKVELSPINILIGANGSGKSNFISFFDFLHELYNQNINDYIGLNGGANKILHKGKKQTYSISFKINRLRHRLDWKE